MERPKPGKNFYFNLFKDSFIESGEIYARLKERSWQSQWGIQYQLITHLVGANILAEVSNNELVRISEDLVPFMKAFPHPHRNIPKGKERQRIMNNMLALKKTARYQIENELDNNNPDGMLDQAEN